MSWYFEALKKYAVFSGRARRKEYWLFGLFNFIITFILGFIEGIVAPSSNMPVLPTLYSLAVLIPGIAVAVRRLHDTGRSGWWLLILLVPLIGPIVFLIFMVEDSQPGENRYGPNPKAGSIRDSDIWECAACGQPLAYQDNECPQCGSTLRRPRTGSKLNPTASTISQGTPLSPKESPGRASNAEGTGVKRKVWIVLAVVAALLLMAGVAQVQKRRPQPAPWLDAWQEQMKERRRLQQIEDYLNDMARYQEQYNRYLERKLEGGFALPPIKPTPPILY